jgi:uncharacterized membrane protein YbaN (DUF454 family)
MQHEKPERRMKIFFTAAGVLFLVLGLAGIPIPVLPTTPFLLLASFCFFKGSPRFHHWLNTHPVFGPRLERFHREGMTAKQKAGVYLLVCVMLTPVFVLTRSFHLRICIIAILLAKAVVFVKIKTAPPKRKHPAGSVSSAI